MKFKRRSTTLPVSAAELQEDDEITIICHRLLDLKHLLAKIVSFAERFREIHLRTFRREVKRRNLRLHSRLHSSQLAEQLALPFSCW